MKRSLFAIALCALVFGHEALSFAGVPANDSPEQVDPVVDNEFSMESIPLLKMRGGNYWTGFFTYSIDLETATVSANWNRMDCSMMTASGEVKLSANDIEEIRTTVEALQYEPLEADEPCYLMADGDESSLRLMRDTNDEKASFHYPMKSWYSRCEGRPLSNESYLKLEKLVYGILPQPTSKEAWTDLDPQYACPRPSAFESSK